MKQGDLRAEGGHGLFVTVVYIWGCDYFGKNESILGFF
jgi:hypothetical protein